MNSIFFFGDRHGDPTDIVDFVKNECVVDATDKIVVCGDFGIPWPTDPKNTDKLQNLQSLGTEIYVCCGNHEWYDRIEKMPLMDEGYYLCEFRGVVYDNIKYITEPLALTLGDKKLLFIPGADSHDVSGGIYPVDVLPHDYMTTEEFVEKNQSAFDEAHERSNGEHFRLQGATWWPQEKTNFTTLDYVIEKNGDTYDYIVSHDMPYPFCKEIQMGVSIWYRYSPTDAEYKLEEYYNKLKFGKWLCGHFHNDKAYDDERIECLFYNVFEG